MSVCVNIRTKKTLTPENILKALADKGEQIFVSNMEFPTITFGTMEKAIRGVEVTQEETGFEVRICSFASFADYDLFRKTIATLMELTDGKAFYEDDDDDQIESPIERFNDEWIELERESTFNVSRAMIRYSGCPIVYFGLFGPFSLGAKMFFDFDIPMNMDYQKEFMYTLEEHYCNLQWLIGNQKNTSTRMVLPAPEESNSDGKRISMITIQGGKVSDFDYISYAPIFGIVDMDNDDIPPVLIPFEQVWKILPHEIFRPLDEWQYQRVEDLTVEMVHEMMKKARSLQPDDFYYDPTEPGQGYDENQNTFILMWNTSISSVTLEDHRSSIENMLTEYFNWSVWDHEKAKIGDRFFLVRVGDGKTGIVMSGVFESQPYEAEDWSGKGRRTFYMDMKPNVILDPDIVPMITTNQLQQAIPSFEWTRGHSGRILKVEDARVLEEIWENYIDSHLKDIDGKTMNVININH